MESSDKYLFFVIVKSKILTISTYELIFKQRHVPISSFIGVNK
jgi:hypothetical protein